MFRCSECSQAAEWIAEWSDRQMFVCHDHRDSARRAHNGDHEYDQTGISWRSSNGQYEYESGEKLQAMPL